MKQKSARKTYASPTNKYQFISLITAHFQIQKSYNMHNKNAAIQFDIIDIDIEPENARQL